jgi:dienelactone hydrolase
VRRRRPLLVAATLTAAALAAPANARTISSTSALTDAVGLTAAADPEPGTPDWFARDADNIARSFGRLQDQYLNPDFHLRLQAETPELLFENVGDQFQHPDRPIVSLGQWVPGGRAADPFRVDWARDGRGLQQPIEYLNRYGARITGNVWAPTLPFTDPITRVTSNGPFPTIVITTGSIQGFEEMYLWAAQGLAEAGYITFTYDVQGQGQSEVFGHRPDGSLWCGQDGCPGVPFQQEANFVEGTEDALLFLLSGANPLRGLVDESRLGLAGHSLGAGAVTKVANRARPVPDEVFAMFGRAPFSIDIDAVVAWDNANLGDEEPRVPTMGQNADYFFNPTPAFSAPNPDAGTATFQRLVDAGVPAMQVGLRSSTHLEWTYIPLILPASSEGERVAMHYTLAWFDRFVKADAEGLRGSARKPAAAIAADARARLTAATFDGSADASAIGAGTYEVGVGNVPHTLAGEAVADHLSIYHRSAYAFDGLACEDLRAGC